MEDALQSVDAPAGEYVRMPARYILQQLEKSAQDSGLPVLGGFYIESEVAGVSDRKISLALGGMTLLEGLEAVAVATGTRLVFEAPKVVLRDPANIVEEPQVVAEKEPAKKTEGDGVDFSDIDTALVFVDTGVGRGSGFIMSMEGKTYLLSNQHNFMGANKIDLTSMHAKDIEVETFEFNRNRDLVRFEIDVNKHPDIGVLEMSDETPQIGQEIAVFGNSAGGNVATELRGEVLGVGPRDIEVDADIVSGNSGSPILNENGEVIGVATYVAFQLEFDKNDKRKQIFKGTRFDKARRYGVRIPYDGWIRVDLRRFLDQTYLLADTQGRLELIRILVEYWNGNDDAEEAAQVILSSYSSRDERVNLPFRFHDSDVEEDVRLMVKAFKRNLDEFIDEVRKMDPDKADLKKMENANTLTSTTKVEQIDYHIRTSMLRKVKQLQDEIKQVEWMSEYLNERAAALDEPAGELIRLLENEKLLVERVKAFD